MFTIYLETGEVIRDRDQKQVAPCQSVDDPDYIEYVEWVNAGNHPAIGKVEEQINAPQSVSPRQIRIALSQLGVREKVESTVAKSSQDIKDSWEFATIINIDDPMVIAFAELLEIDLKQLFVLASTL